MPHCHRKSLAIVFALLLCAMLITRVQAKEVKPDDEALRWMQMALDRWEDTCRRHLHLPIEPLAWVIFYDDHYAWHVSAEKDLLPPHETATVTLNFAGQPRALARVAHKQGLWVPGRDETLPIQVDLSAMPYADDQKTFCIIPLPALFHTVEGLGTAAEMDEFFLGIALHELTHTRQLSLVMKQLRQLRKRYPLPEHLDDNLLEDTFSQNKAYAQGFNREMEALGNAAMADTTVECRRKGARALAIIQRRRAHYFVGKRKMFAPLEEIFLMLEGTGMWVHFQMARERAPAGEDVGTTLNKLAAKTNAWSQVEGLALFLLMDRLIPDWRARYFAPNPPSPFAVLQAAVRPKKAAAKRHKR